jgi:hypothetical protein
MLANPPIGATVPTYDLQRAKRCYEEVYSDHSGFKGAWFKNPEGNILVSSN